MSIEGKPDDKTTCTVGVLSSNLGTGSFLIMKEDPYKILGIAHRASLDEIKSAYRREAMTWHPDRNPGNEEAAAVHFNRIRGAYESLSGSSTEYSHSRTAPRPMPTYAEFLREMADLEERIAQVEPDPFSKGRLAVVALATVSGVVFASELTDPWVVNSYLQLFGDDVYQFINGSDQTMQQGMAKVIGGSLGAAAGFAGILVYHWGVVFKESFHYSWKL